MARTGKVGIDYWSHDSDMSNDPKIRIIMAKHGLLGYGMFNLLLDRLYSEKGYYLQLSDDFNILFSNDCKLELNVYILILNDCIEKTLFDKELYEKYNILTSQRIQKTYCDACQRRKEVFFKEEFLLIDAEKHFPDRVNVNIEQLNVCINKQNVGINLQKKEKGERKENEKKSEKKVTTLKCVADAKASAPVKKKKNTEPKSRKTWESYSKAYFKRYGVEPVRNAQVNSILSRLVDAVGSEFAPRVAEYYLTSCNAWYLKKGHNVKFLLDDAQKLFTEMQTGQRMSNARANEADRLQSSGENWQSVIDEYGD